jgi:PncC family amidohydrolase
MQKSALPFVLISDDPHLVLSRVRLFQKSSKNVRVEAAMSFPEIRVGIFPAEWAEGAGGARCVAVAAGGFKKRFSRYIVSDEGCSVPVHFVRELAARRLTFACAESCTGGMVADLVTMVPGSSDVFAAAVVCYDNGMKRKLLGVKKKTLARYGAVSVQVVEEMLAGVMAETGADCAVATSGTAGPAGGTRLKPVGTVYYGAAVGEERVVRKAWLAGMGRGEVKTMTSYLALKLLLDGL